MTLFEIIEEMKNWPEHDDLPDGCFCHSRMKEYLPFLLSQLDRMRELVEEASEVPCQHDSECGACFSCRCRKELGGGDE